ncbi:MAG: hypothetical protein Q9227_007872 [Pyrenula ochraceoflavens]
MSSSLEAKIVVLGSQGVGKTSLLHRYINNTFSPTPPQSTLGASFSTKHILDTTSDTSLRLQIWDTAGQERFRSISRLYYRGANAGLLCYDITSEKSWEDMKGWLRELREQCGGGVGGEGLVLHVVGTKSDLVAEDPSRRKVPFERTIAYVAEQLGPSQGGTPPQTSAGGGAGHFHAPAQSLLGALTPGSLQSSREREQQQQQPMHSPDSKRSSGFWGQDAGWDSCHEVSARDGEGIEEVFRVIARKLVEQRNRRMEREAALRAATPGWDARSVGDYGGGGGGGGYFDGTADGGGAGNTGSFRVGHGDKRRSWLGIPSNLNLGNIGDGENENTGGTRKRKGRCC